MQLTFDRIARFIPLQNIYVSTFTDYVPLVKTQLPELEDAQILAEPAQLSTAPAAAWASWYISQRNPEACIVASPADQFITNEAAFEQELLQGLDYVREHPQFLAMSVKATTPNTAYGYLQKGKSIDQKRFMRKSFTEKTSHTSLPKPSYQVVNSCGTRDFSSGTCKRWRATCLNSYPASG